MAELDPIQNLHVRVSPLLAVPSLQSYSRALSVIEEFVELAATSPHPDSPATAELLHICTLYRMLCDRCIIHLTRQAAARERETYRRASSTRRRNAGISKSKRKRHGVVFNVDKGDHVAAALEALQLEDFLEKEEKAGPKQVRFSK